MELFRKFNQSLRILGSIWLSSSIKLGDNTDAASADNVGSIRSRVSGNYSYIDICTQTNTGTYEWVNVLQSNYSIKSDNYSASAYDIFLEVTVSGRTITLPESPISKIFRVVNTSTGNITLACSGAQLIGNINPTSTFVVSPGKSYSIITNGNGIWRIF